MSKRTDQQKATDAALENFLLEAANFLVHQGPKIAGVLETFEDLGEQVSELLKGAAKERKKI